ncbi:hypothetical protein BH23BAC1_BH23BAC1_11150 [soil metagenome]
MNGNKIQEREPALTILFLNILEFRFNIVNYRNINIVNYRNKRIGNKFI